MTPFWSKRSKQKSLGEVFGSAPKGDPAGGACSCFSLSFFLLLWSWHGSESCSHFLSTMKNEQEHLRVWVSKTMSALPTCRYIWQGHCLGFFWDTWSIHILTYSSLIISLPIHVPNTGSCEKKSSGDFHCPFFFLLLKRKPQDQMVRGTTPWCTTWPKCCFNLSQKNTTNQLVWNFLVNTHEVISQVGPPQPSHRKKRHLCDKKPLPFPSP